MASLNPLISYLAGGDQTLRVGHPFERLRLPLVVKRDEVLGRGLEILNGIVDAVPEPSAGQLPEEAKNRRTLGNPNSAEPGEFPRS